MQPRREARFAFGLLTRAYWPASVALTFVEHLRGAKKSDDWALKHDGQGFAFESAGTARHGSRTRWRGSIRAAARSSSGIATVTWCMKNTPNVMMTNGDRDQRPARMTAS
jgi:hypothetical protein